MRITGREKGKRRPETEEEIWLPGVCGEKTESKFERKEPLLAPWAVKSGDDVHGGASFYCKMHKYETAKRMWCQG